MDIKAKIRESKFAQWEIAELLGMADTTLCRKLRRPSAELIERIEEIIKEGESE